MANKNVIWCDKETLSKDLSGKVYIVTGANSGVGLETTRQLVKQGAHVVMACRRVENAKKVAQSFASLKASLKTSLRGSYEVMRCDLADLASVRNFVEEFLSSHKKLDGLMGNAGLVVMGSKAHYTVDGFEETIGVNYLGHFLMIELLLDLLKKSAPSRIGILSSVVHAGSPKNRPKVHLDDLNYKNRKYSAFAAYAEAKVAVVQYAMELGERLKGTKVAVFSIHPGWARSNFGGNGLVMQLARVLFLPFKNSMTNSNEESAQTSLHCLISDDAVNHSGAYFSQHSVLYADKECKKGGWPMESPNPQAKDMEAAKKLVQMSYKLVGLKK